MVMTTPTIIGKLFQQNRFQKLDVAASFVMTMSSNYFTSILRATSLPTMLHLPWCQQTKNLPLGRKITTADITTLFSKFHLSMVLMAKHGKPSRVISDWSIYQRECRCGPTLYRFLSGLSNNRKLTGTKIQLRKVRHGLLIALYLKVCLYSVIKYIMDIFRLLFSRRWGTGRLETRS